jgi:hypothetical protein
MAPLENCRVTGQDPEFFPVRLGDLTESRAIDAAPSRLSSGTSIARLQCRTMSFGHRPASPANDDPLEEVLTAERAAADAIAAARRDAGAWLAVEQQAIQAASRADFAALDGRHAADIDAALKAAAAHAADTVSAAERHARELLALTDDELRRIVSDRLNALLPGGAP